MCKMHKSFPHHKKVLFDFHKREMYDVDAERNTVPNEIGGEC